jgi:hypothetical protein
MNNRYTLGGIAALAMLAGCGGQVAPTGGITGAASASHGKSWVLPEAKSEDLLYISDVSTVDVYSYPQAKLVGKLTGFYSAAALCVDRAGNVWVGDSKIHYDSFSLIEYAHGGSKPIKTLSDSGEGEAYFVSACSVDSTTGNLAAVNWSDGPSGQGNVAIFLNASGSPKIYTGYYIHPFGAAYDDNGDLFVDSDQYYSGSGCALYELRAGKQKFKPLRLRHVYDCGGVQWDGKHIAVGDSDQDVIYKFAVHGRHLRKVASTSLGGADDVVQFWIQGANVIGPNNLSTTAMIWKYPAGGDPVRTITGLNEPWDATVSLASK